MENRINLNNFDIRTDLVIDSYNNIKDDIGLNKQVYDENDIHVTRIEISDNDVKYFNKDKGRYITIEFPDITNYEDRELLERVFLKELKLLYSSLGIDDNDECLVVGLGNEKSTPDSLGPKTLKTILVTRHLFLLSRENVKKGMRCVSVFAPNVMGNTGLESADLILEIARDIKPKFIIAIDALASNSISRINRTIQITDSGIHPGSGIGNNRKEISKKTIGIPVIAIGIPTVVDVSTVIGDTINYLYKHISYIKNNYNENKLIFTRKNYLKKIENNDLTFEEKKALGGLLGELGEDEIKKLFDEVLTSIDYNMMVTVKEIDFVIEKLAGVVSAAINNSLHLDVDNY